MTLAIEIIGKLDRRRTYAIVDGVLCYRITWSESCSGCSGETEHGAPDRGAGCRECGYTGRSRCVHWEAVRGEA